MRFALLLLLAGCSFIAVHRAPKPPWPAKLDCTTSYVPPVADVAMTGALIGYGVATAVVEGPCDNWCPHDLTAKGVAVLIAAVGGISAIYGVIAVHDCRVANEQLAYMKEHPEANAYPAVMHAQQAREACVRDREQQFAALGHEPNKARRAELLDQIAVCDDANARLWPPTIALARRALHDDCEAVAADAKTMLATDGAHYERVLLANPDIAACVSQVRDNCLRTRTEAQRKAMDEVDLERRAAALQALPQCDR